MFFHARIFFTIRSFNDLLIVRRPAPLEFESSANSLHLYSLFKLPLSVTYLLILLTIQL